MNLEKNSTKTLLEMGTAATDLESRGHELEAYRAYLACVQGVCSLLNGGLSADTYRSQMIALARQCLDRIQHISDRFGRKKLPPGPEPASRSPEAAATLVSVQSRLRRLQSPSLEPSDTAWTADCNVSSCEPTGPSAPWLDDSDTSSIEDNQQAPHPKHKASAGFNGFSPARRGKGRQKLKLLIAVLIVYYVG